MLKLHHFHIINQILPLKLDSAVENQGAGCGDAVEGLVHRKHERMCASFRHLNPLQALKQTVLHGTH